MVTTSMGLVSTTSQSPTTSAAASTSFDAVALTTTFTPASSCTIDFYKYSYDGVVCLEGTSTVSCEFFHLGQTTSGASCLPTGWSDASAAYYSPGVCPAGYDQACSTTVGSETRATCCPSGYACQTKASMPWQTTDICTSQMTGTQVFVYTTSIAGKGNVESTVTGVEGLNAFGLRIRYEATDFPSSTPTSSMPSNTGSSAPGATSTSTTANNSNNNNSSGGLSSGAKAGIGIGVALGVLALLGALAFFFWRRRAAARGARGEAPGPSNSAMGGYMGSPGTSPGAGVAYTAVSPVPNEMAATGGGAAGAQAQAHAQDQKYYYGTAPQPAYNDAPPPIAEVSGETTWTAPMELPAESVDHTRTQAEYR